MAQASKQFVCNYDAPLDDVMAMLLDEGFRNKVCEAQGLLSHNVSITKEGDTTLVAIDKQQPMAGLPSVATKFLGARTDVRQRETWTGTDMTLTLEIPGKPGGGTGNVTVVSKDGKTVETVEINVEVSVPLVGGKVAGIIIDQFVAAMEAEYEVGKSWLAGER
ncbi:DUF2505 domain-containing protein [Mycobacterium bourgelatii]|uniref:DUF2505 domain-containing protein n=1 Tax=Mycobacterium bourgelatii TaxID=1273442 RepID=A0A7I9YQX7_MYCBU|nr:DUF2505 domain-containing protein [Mycobacterium bourgelatii]MCV6974458.1 DUF2505 domain-containing protein [Mycobacterium bourgelatii]GFG91080.1 hypothetical protein MBOU_31220 [Mycobacterium bourgelatii]